MPPTLDSALVWFRRDLRAVDHAALYHALRSARRVWCVFVFDTDILCHLPRVDRRVEFIHHAVQDLHQQLKGLSYQVGGGLMVRYGRASDCVTRLALALQAQAVFANHDDDPFALQRDAQTQKQLSAHGMALHTYKDHVIFERDEVLTQSKGSFSVFTPYKNAWLKKVTPFYLRAYPVEKYADRLAAIAPEMQQPLPLLEELGFERSNLGQIKLTLGSQGAQALWSEFEHKRMQHYDQTRDFPAVKGPSYLSAHLRFGTISIRTLARRAYEQSQQGLSGASVWLSELIWRDFYHQILFHHPHVVGCSFKPAYDRIEWRSGDEAEADFDAWCCGQTGYPLVDAAMRQLNQTGYMHNRLRMVVASFLIKDLGLDWRRGEAYFAQQLLDFDLAANNGGWQWAASSGCDAQPYFRIFNPVSQSEKFDAQGQFIKRYVPELAALDARYIHAPWEAPADVLRQAGIQLGAHYPHPRVSHAQARLSTLERYAVVKGLP